MNWQLWLYVVGFVFATITLFGLSYVVYEHLERQTAPQLLGILLGAGIWTGSDAVVLLSTDSAIMLFMNNVGFIGYSLVVLSSVLFALEYTNRERYLTRRNVIVLALPFVILIVASCPL